MSMKILAAIKKCLMSVIIRLSQNAYHSNKLVNRKMKDKTGGAAIEEFVALKPKMYWFLVDNSEHKKVKGVNRNVVATIIVNIKMHYWIVNV